MSDSSAIPEPSCQGNPSLSQQRDKGIDIARGLAILFFIPVHLLENVVNKSVMKSMGGQLFLIADRFLCASVLMFLMGVSFSLSKNFTMKKGIIRGFIIFLLGYVLNVFRGSLPLQLSIWFGDITYVELVPHTPFYSFQEIDILQFAGLAIIAISLFRSLVLKHMGIAVTIIVTVLFVSALPIGKSSNYLFQMFFGHAKYAHFFFFPWIGYPLFGLVYGHWYVRSRHTRSFARQSILSGLALMGLGLVMYFTVNKPNQLKLISNILYALRQSETGVVFFCGFTMIYLPLCTMMARVLPDIWVRRKLYFYSENITVFYVAQWVLIGFCTLDLSLLFYPSFFFYMALIWFASDRIALLHHEKKRGVSDIPAKREVA